MLILYEFRLITLYHYLGNLSTVVFRVQLSRVQYRHTGQPSTPLPSSPSPREFKHKRVTVNPTDLKYSPPINYSNSLLAFASHESYLYLPYSIRPPSASTFSIIIAVVLYY